MRIRSLFPAALALLGLAAAAWAQSAQDVAVWHIGNFDHTAAEFSGRAGDQPVIVDADAPDAARHWPASQSGTLNAESSPISHSRLVRFRLADPPRGTYVLDFAILAGNPRVPHLDLDLNGTPGTAYLDRYLSYHAEGRADSPINAESRTTVLVPAAALRQGPNELRITAVDDAPDENGDSSITWDALALRHLPAPAIAPAAIYESTYFFSTEKGVTRELVTATVATHEIVSAGKLTFSLAGAEYHADLAAGRFGQQRFEFQVPEFAARAEIGQAVELNGKTYRAGTRLSPKRKLTVYIVPHTHLDIGFTDYQPKIEELQNRNLDRLLEEMRRDRRYALLARWRLAGRAVSAHAFGGVAAGIPGAWSAPAASPSPRSTPTSWPAAPVWKPSSAPPTPATPSTPRPAAPTDYANITDVPAVSMGLRSRAERRRRQIFRRGRQ